MAPGGAGGAESGGGVVLVPGSRPRPRPHLHRRPGPGPGTGIPAPRSRLLVAPSAGGGRSEDLRVGGRSERGRRVTAARCAAGRPVAETPYLGAARPVPWGRLITVVPGRKAFCVSALVDGAGGRGRRGIGRRRGSGAGLPAPAPAPFAPPARPRPRHRHPGTAVPSPGGAFGGRGAV